MKDTKEKSLPNSIAYVLEINEHGTDLQKGMVLGFLAAISGQVKEAKH